MAYAITNPPRMLVSSVGKQGGSLWMYQTTDTLSGTNDSGYFTNGYSLGIRPGDIVFAVNTTSFAAQIMVCNAGTSDATLDFTDGVAIALTDSD